MAFLERGPRPSPITRWKQCRGADSRLQVHHDMQIAAEQGRLDGGVTGSRALSIHGASKAAIRAPVRNPILGLKGRGIRINVLGAGCYLDAGPSRARQRC